MLEQNEQFVRQLTKAQSRVFAFILSVVRDPVEADEILQETNIVLLRKCGSYVPGTDFGRWAFQVAYYEVLKSRDRTRKQSSSETLLSDDILDTLATEAIAEEDVHNVQQQALASCLDQLPPTDRQLVYWRYGEEMPIAALSARVGRTVAAVYKALNRIQWRLVQCVRQRLIAQGGT